MARISFGTEGWRAVIADDFTFANLAAVTQGIAAYVTEQRLDKKGIVVGYDNRFLSERFARTVAQVLAGNGIRVLLMRRVCPTPVTAFAVRERGAGGAVVVTASHNPPEYSGLKFIPSHAGPAPVEVTERIGAEVQRVLASGKVYELPLGEAEKLGLVEECEPEQEYLQHLARLVQAEHVRKARLRVVVDPMYGAGIGYLERVLESWGCEVRVIHGYRDPLFGGLPPEPTERRLEDLRRSVRTYDAALGLALDGDADRFGVVDERGEFFPANRLLPMLLEHLLQTRSFRGPVARTVATTHMLDRVARHYGLGVVETPVGFKYVSQCLRERGCILGGEESGGLSIFGHVPYRDGVLAGLLTAEMVGRAGKPLSALYADFAAVHGRVEYERLDLPLSERDCERVRAHLQEYTPKAIAGVKVEDTVLLDGRKFLLEDGSWVLVRPAGTEQLLRLYVEAHDRVRLADIQKEVQLSLGLLAQ